MDRDAISHIMLAVGEACNNGILYGVSQCDRILSVTCRLAQTDNCKFAALEIDVRNHGDGFVGEMDWSKHAMPAAELMAEHGRGLPLMRSAVDHVQFLSEGGDTIVRLVKHLSR
jgi:anti-sigma regulatory factor (Ser/Thr protein kinase)